MTKVTNLIRTAPLQTSIKTWLPFTSQRSSSVWRRTLPWLCGYANLCPAWRWLVLISYYHRSMECMSWKLIEWIGKKSHELILLANHFLLYRPNLVQYFLLASSGSSFSTRIGTILNSRDPWSSRLDICAPWTRQMLLGSELNRTSWPTCQERVARLEVQKQLCIPIGRW